MQSVENGFLERNNSQASNISHKSGAGRSRSRKHSWVTQVPDSAKSLVSFPSLSPDNSPSPSGQGKFGSNPFTQSNVTTPHRSAMHHPAIVETLLRNSSSFRGRSALFEDSPKRTKNVPGTLHLSSDEHLEHLIAKTGAVELVRQLAEDLAQRNAEIVSLRRRAEERERELKRMLREVEVSNLDIETRLHRIGTLERDSKATESKQPDSKAIPPKANPGNRLTKSTSEIDEMMGEAMKDDVGIGLNEEYLDLLDGPDKHSVTKAEEAGLRENGHSAQSSIDSQDRPKNAFKGWKSYLWNGDATSRKISRASSIMSEYDDVTDTVVRVRAPSGGNIRRKGLDDDLFRPPHRTATTHSTSSDNQSRKSSTSIASWTMKLFAGNHSAGREPDGQSTIRGRSATLGSGTSKPSRATSDAPGPLPSSAKAALMKVNGSASDFRARRKTVEPLNLGSNSLVKVASQPSNSQLPGSPAAVGASTSLGPVEMDTILPLDSRPPTLRQSNITDRSSEFLTDRFGFIYDQRRRKRETAAARVVDGKGNQMSGVEMLNSRDQMKIKDHKSLGENLEPKQLQRPESPTSTDDKAEERPIKRWQDYLKTATSPTELLSHTPSPNPAVDVTGSESQSSMKRSLTSGDGRGSLPSSNPNLQPLASPVTADNAEIVKPSVMVSGDQSTPAVTEAEPVRMLLTQLTELHDSLQRDRTVKWNEFLRKVRAERKKEELVGSTDARSKQVSMPEATLADGEMIGVAGLGNKGKVGLAKWNEFKQLVLTGIPVAYRAKIWAECSGASALRVPGYYDDIVSNGDDDPVILAQIQMDINRTLTDNVFFRKGPGVAKLNEVLVAYSRRNPEIGYCQGMNLITASLLLIMPSAEDAFWVLTSMIETILPRHYYDHSLLTSRADQQVLRQYVAEILPKLSAHLDALGIELEALTFQWFLSVFTDCLSAEALFRVWDVVLCFNDGSTFLFQVALALLKLNEAPLLECGTAATVYEYIGRKMTDHAISIDGLVRASEALKKVVKRGEVEERRRMAVEKERARGMGVDTGTSRSNSDTELRPADPIPIADEI